MRMFVKPLWLRGWNVFYLYRDTYTYDNKWIENKIQPERNQTMNDSYLQLKVNYYNQEIISECHERILAYPQQVCPRRK